MIDLYLVLATQLGSTKHGSPTLTSSKSCQARRQSKAAIAPPNVTVPRRAHIPLSFHLDADPPFEILIASRNWSSSSPIMAFRSQMLAQIRAAAWHSPLLHLCEQGER